MQDPKKEGDKSFPVQEILKASSIVFYQLGLEPESPICFMGSNVADILGFDPNYLEGKASWVDQIHESDRERVASLYDDIHQTKRSVAEYRFRHKDGHYIWLRDEIRLTTDDEGNPHSIVGAAVEITDQKQAEEKLQKLNKTLEERISERTSKLSTANRKLKKQIQHRKKAESQLKEQHKQLELQELAIDNLNDMVIVTKAPKDDPLNSEIIFVNRAFEKFTGYEAEKVIGRNPDFLHGPKTSEKIKKKVNEQIKNRKSLREEFINYKKDGTPYWVELDMSPFPTSESGFEYWVGINRDITQRKKAERKLEESEKRYRAFAELSFDAIFEIALDGTILDCNKRATELFGYDRSELVGMNTVQLMPEEYRESQPDIISDSVTTGDEAWERTYKKKDGTYFPTEIHTKTYEIGDQKRLIAYVRDNTAHKKYENAIRKSLKEKETLLSEVHHRVKNNLAIISGLLEMQVFNTDDEQLLYKLQESQSRIQSIAMVHEKLYSSDSFSEIAIDDYINDLLGIVTDSMADFEKSVTIEKDMDSVTLAVGQAIPCGLLLNELITNSYKHAFENRDKGTIKICLSKEGKTIVLSVQDNGVGLPDDFDIQNESSLGMTLVNTLVKQLEGELKVSSKQGSHFTITFDINQ